MVADANGRFCASIRALAPVKAAILPLIAKSEDMVAQARALYEELRRRQCVEYDDGGAIGRRYRRQDEIGTPFAFTIDEQTLEDETVTVRDRDSLAQERLPISGVRRGSTTRSSGTGSHRRISRKDQVPGQWPGPGRRPRARSEARWRASGCPRPSRG